MSSRASREAHHATRFTVETALWILVALGALALRLTNLGVAPLSAAEAHEAVLAWRAATGAGPPQVDYNPLLLVLNALLFTVCGASDALARLWPALFGGALVLAPWLLRRQLGRIGALAAGVYLAISPTALAASRQLDGAVIAASGVMAFFGGAARFADADRRPWLILAAVGLALGVTGGASAYGLLLPLALAWLLIRHVMRDTRYAARFTHHASRVLSVFVAAALALSTGLGWNLGGVGAVGGLLADWFARFRPASRLSTSPLTLLVVYELLALIFGVGGLIWSVRRGRGFSVLLGLWAGLGVLLLLLMPGRAPLDLLWVVLPLAMLAGIGVEALALARETDGVLRVVYGSVVLMLWAHCYLMLARYGTFGDRADLALALVSIVLQVLLGVSFALAMGVDDAVQAGAAGTGIALLALTLSAGWGAAHARPADPRELLTSRPTDVGVRDLVHTLRDISWRETGLPTTLAFTFEAPPDSVLAWYLRDFGAARRVDRLPGLQVDKAGSVLVKTGRRQIATGSPEDAGYIGQDFPLHRRWSSTGIDCGSWIPLCKRSISWFLFREVSLPEPEEWATVWRREGESADRVSYSD